MPYKFNPITGQLDYYESMSGSFVAITGDEMTGELINSSITDVAFRANKSIVIKSGYKIVYDGA